MSLFITVFFPSADHLPFKVIYHTVGFKDAEAKVFLSLPITAKILEVERFTSVQDRFNITTQRSVNKVHTDTCDCITCIICLREYVVVSEINSHKYERS